MTTFTPQDEDQVLEAVRWAAAEKTPLALCGNGSKDGIGHVVEAQNRLDLSGLQGIVLYEPEELVLSALPGTSIADIESALDENNQIMAFDPPDFSHIFNHNKGATLGGVVASGLSGPRRVRHGAVRDHVLGIRAVSGRGEMFVSGGRVVKNVTGYDLPKVLTGSWGTLAAMTSVTIKVLPRPESEKTLLLTPTTRADGLKAMTVALSLPIDLASAAMLPDGDVALRLDGFKPSVKARMDRLVEAVASFGEAEMSGKGKSAKLWRGVRDLSDFSRKEANALWRLCVTPSKAEDVVSAITEKHDARVLVDWGGGLIWVELLNEETACAATVRTAVKRAGGHATLTRGDSAARAGNAVFQPMPPVLAGLSNRLKAAFDPHDVLNPGRMYASAGGKG